MLDLLIRDRTRFGPGAIHGIGAVVDDAGGARAFVVTDGGVVRSGVIDRVVGALASTGIDAAVFDGVEPNPGTASVL